MARSLTQLLPHRWQRVACVALVLVAVVAVGLAAQAARIRQAAQAYLFAYPLVIMDHTRDHHARRTGVQNALSLSRQFPTPQFKEVVRPNLDTLYATAFLDIQAGPWQLDLPPNDERYELVTFLDAWSDVFATTGTSTHGGKGERLWLVGPHWQGAPPPGVRVVHAPTRLVWMIGRIQARGVQDLPRVHALQDRWKLHSMGAAQPALAATSVAMPNSQARADGSPLADMAAMGTRDFYRHLAVLMRDNPPRPQDAEMLGHLRGFGVVPGAEPSTGPWDAALLALGRWLAMRAVQQELNKSSPHQHGWKVAPMNLGRFGIDYPTRAAVAIVGLGANLAQDTLYAQAQADASGRPLNGSQAYRIRFEPGQWPPVNAFWSVTAYDADGFLLDHPSHRHLVRNSDPLQPQADGALELWVQPEPPPQPYTANWVPVVSGQAFTLNLRLYGPQAPALSQAWSPPPIQPRP